MEEKFEKLGQLIDSLDNIVHALNIPMTDNFHVKQIKVILPVKVDEFKKLFVEITGDNPWD